MTPTDLCYRYRLKPWILWFLTAITIFALGMMAFGYSHDGTLKTAGGKPVNPIVMGVLLLGLMGWLVYLVLLIKTELQGGRTITLTARNLVVPKVYWSSEYVSIPYAKITQLKFVANRGRLMITYEGGHNGIAGPYFPSHEKFQEFTDILYSRTEAEKSETFSLEPY
jgi:hypothetical protein